MDNPYESVARRAALRLAASLDPNLPALTERALADDGAPRETTRSAFDITTGIALSSLLLNVVKFGWDAYRSLQSDRAKERETKEKAEADDSELRQMLIRRMRLNLGEPRSLTVAQRDLLLETVAEEILVSEDSGRR
jgi:hypothetical protein